MPKVEVEPVVITQPPHQSRQQRRAEGRAEAKNRERANKKIAIEYLAKFKADRKRNKQNAK